MYRHLLTLTIALTIITACSDSGTSNNPPNPPSPTETAAYTITMNTTLEPGRETEQCQFFTIPEPGLWISRQKSNYSPGVHHILLWTTEYETVPTQDQSGTTVDTSKPFDCPEGPNGLWQTNAVAGGIQSVGSPDFVDLPKGVAYHLRPGVVLLNLHVLNTTEQMLNIQAGMDFYTLPEAEIEHEAGITFFYNYFIRVPPRGTSRARMSCPVPQEVHLVNAQSHMHSRGRAFEAKLIAADGSAIETFYRHDRGNENVPMESFGTGKRIAAGTSIEYTCDFASEQDGEVIQGLTTEDEMCMFLSAYYPRSEAFEWCSPEGLTQGPPSLGATFYGNGSASCAETLSCIVGSDPDPFTSGMQGCVLDSCAASAVEVSGVVRCMMSQGYGACVDICDNAPEGCGECIQGACAEDFGACFQSSCEGPG